MTSKTSKQTTAAFIKAKIVEGKLEDKAILAAARKRAPGQKIGDNYVSWYRWQLSASKSTPVKKAPAKKTAKRVNRNPVLAHQKDIAKKMSKLTEFKPQAPVVQSPIIQAPAPV